MTDEAEEFQVHAYELDHSTMISTLPLFDAHYDRVTYSTTEPDNSNQFESSTERSVDRESPKVTISLHPIHLLQELLASNANLPLLDEDHPRPL